MSQLDVRPVVLVGSRLRLEPLSPEHAKPFVEVAEVDLFRLFAGIVVHDQTLAGLQTYVAERLATPNTVSFAQVVLADDRPVGHTSYMSIRPRDRVVEIGATWIGRAYQGTFVNPEAKFLLMRHAFEDLGCVRVELKTDERNLHSQHAMEKLGLVREGVLRKHAIAADGTIRNTVYYSVVDDEWPAMKARLLARLAAIP